MRGANPLIEVCTETIPWLKKQWEEMWKRPENNTEELVTLFSISKDGQGTVKDHWDKVQEATAKCKLEEIEADSLDKTMP